MIRANQARRAGGFSSMLAGLEAKYCQLDEEEQAAEAGTKRKKKKKPKKGAEN